MIPSPPQSTPPPSELAPGSRFGKYQVVKRLAVGGMGEIFLAQMAGQERSQRALVLKRLLPQLAVHARFVQLFTDEACVAATLHHPNLVQVFDVGLVDGHHFMSMEYLFGENLRAIMRTVRTETRPLPMEHAIHIVLSVCAGLHYAHEKQGFDGKPQGLVHRDVTPQNIFVTFDGAVKLIDFGAASAPERSPETGLALRGTVSYMSPELCRGEPVDRRSDLFSLGVVLYELTLGQRLFPGKSDFEVMKKVVEGRVVPPTELNPRYPPVLEQIVMRLLAKERGQRFLTAAALGEELENFLRTSRLFVSQMGLKHYMTRLFAPRLEAWRKAERAGQTLTEHLASLPEETSPPELEGEAPGDRAAPLPKAAAMPAAADPWLPPIKEPPVSPAASSSLSAPQRVAVPTAKSPMPLSSPSSPSADSRPLLASPRVAVPTAKSPMPLSSAISKPLPAPAPVTKPVPGLQSEKTLPRVTVPRPQPAPKTAAPAAPTKPANTVEQAAPQEDTRPLFGIPGRPAAPTRTPTAPPPPNAPHAALPRVETAPWPSAPPGAKAPTTLQITPPAPPPAAPRAVSPTDAILAELRPTESLLTAEKEIDLSPEEDQALPPLEGEPTRVDPPRFSASQPILLTPAPLPGIALPSTTPLLAAPTLAASPPPATPAAPTWAAPEPSVDAYKIPPPQRWKLLLPLGAAIASIAGGLVFWSRRAPLPTVPVAPVIVSKRPSAPTPPSQPNGFGSLRLLTTPRGAHLRLDGKPLKQITPTTLDHLSAEEDHELVLSLDRYEPRIEHIHVQPNQQAKLDLRLLLAARRSALPRLPREIASDSEPAPKAVHPTLSSSSGAASDAEHPRRLAPESSSEWTPTLVPLRPENSGGQRPSLPAPEAGALPKPPGVPRPLGSTEGSGTIVVEAEPPCMVAIDGAWKGPTPLRLEAPAGHHVLFLSNPSLNIRRAVPIVVRPGETTSKSFTFDQ